MFDRGTHGARVWLIGGAGSSAAQVGNARRTRGRDTDSAATRLEGEILQLVDGVALHSTKVAAGRLLHFSARSRREREVDARLPTRLRVAFARRRRPGLGWSGGTIRESPRAARLNAIASLSGHRLAGPSPQGPRPASCWGRGIGYLPPGGSNRAPAKRLKARPRVEARLSTLPPHPHHPHTAAPRSDPGKPGSGRLYDPAKRHAQSRSLVLRLCRHRFEGIRSATWSRGASSIPTVEL